MNTHFVIIKEDDGKPFGCFKSNRPMVIEEVLDLFSEMFFIIFDPEDTSTTQEEFDKEFIKFLSPTFIQEKYNPSIVYEKVLF